jgi:FKBP-type peptidyl-prolyl cis-trans isomerase (trigger factor)
MCEANVHELLQEVDGSLGRVTVQAEFQFIRDAFATVPRRLSMIEEKFDGKLERILSKLEKMNELVKELSQKRPSNQRAFIESLIEWSAVKSISFRSVNHQLFQEMVQRTNPDFSVPVDNTLKRHIKRLAEAYRELPERQEKNYYSLMADGPKKSANVSWRSPCSWKDTFDSWT